VSIFCIRQNLVLCLLLLPWLVAEAEIKISTLNSHMPRIQASAMVMGRIYRQLKVDWRLLRIPTDDALKGANSGVVDGELIRIKGIEDSLNRLQRIPYPIARIKLIAYTPEGSGLVTSIADLAGRSIAVIRGVALTDGLTKGQERHYADTVEGLFRLLDSKQADIVLTFKLDADLYLASSGKQADYLTSAPLLEVEMYHYLHKRNDKLIDRLTRHMQRLDETGELERMISQAEAMAIYPK